VNGVGSRVDMMFSHWSPLQSEKPADFRFGSARLLGKETGVKGSKLGAGKVTQSRDRAQPAPSCYSALGATLAKPAVARAF